MESRDFFGRIHGHLMARDGSLARVHTIFDGAGTGDPVFVPGLLLLLDSMHLPTLYVDPAYWDMGRDGASTSDAVHGVRALLHQEFRTTMTVEEAMSFFATRVAPTFGSMHGWPRKLQYKQDIWMFASG